VGTPSVVVACGSDAARWRPLDAARHRVLWQALPCRPCAHFRCPTGHECALAVEADAVSAQALAALREPHAKEPHHAAG
jgi:ADP-heptose:LPS heptosyltransferase